MRRQAAKSANAIAQARTARRMGGPYRARSAISTERPRAFLSGGDDLLSIPRHTAGRVARVDDEPARRDDRIPIERRVVGRDHDAVESRERCGVDRQGVELEDVVPAAGAASGASARRGRDTPRARRAPRGSRSASARAIREDRRRPSCTRRRARGSRRRRARGRECRARRRSRSTTQYGIAVLISPASSMNRVAKSYWRAFQVR